MCVLCMIPPFAQFYTDLCLIQFETVLQKCEEKNRNTLFLYRWCAAQHSVIFSWSSHLVKGVFFEQKG